MINHKGYIEEYQSEKTVIDKASIFVYITILTMLILLIRSRKVTLSCVFLLIYVPTSIILFIIHPKKRIWKLLFAFYPIYKIRVS